MIVCVHTLLGYFFAKFKLKTATEIIEESKNCQLTVFKGKTFTNDVMFICTKLKLVHGLC